MVLGHRAAQDPLGSLIIALGLLVDDAIIGGDDGAQMEEATTRCAATFAYEITAMPMLTGTLITAAGFPPIGIAKSTTGEYTFAIFAVTVIALVLSWFGGRCSLPLPGTLLLKVPPMCPTGWQAHHRPHEMFDTPFYRSFRRLVDWCVVAPLDHHRRHVADCSRWACGHGQSSSSSSRIPAVPRILVDIWSPEGTSFAANEDVAARGDLAQPGRER